MSSVTHILSGLLRRFVDEGASHVVMDASSIVPAECRLDGTDLAVACFTNLTHDHLDSHGSMGAYEAAKLHLFDLARGAVVNTDDVVGRRVAEGGESCSSGKGRRGEHHPSCPMPSLRWQ